MDSVFQFISQLWKAFKTLTPSKRLAVVAVAAISLVSIAAFVAFVNQKEYRVLFSNLSAEDAGEILARLQEKKIPYKVSPSSDSILVPSERVSELRLNLAASGLPQGGGVGFEIFDKKNFGVTEFVQQLNYQRALQGELSRTINSLDEIQQSRVHIVMPKQSLFVEKQAKPTASVIIKLKPGRRLRATQVEGITHLVASSVEGLQPGEVTIVDSGGNILSKAVSESQLSKRTNTQMEYQTNIEKGLAHKIQSMLEKVVGEGKVVARVSAALNFKVIEKTEEIYDPEEPVVRSLHRKSEKSRPPVSEGESTVSPTNRQDVNTYNPDHEKTDETINYEINRVVSKTVLPVGGVERLSVAVLVDGVYRKNDKGVEEFQPRLKKEMKTLEDLVRRSVGFDAARGDQVIVTSTPFRKIELDTGPAEKSFWKVKSPLFISLMKYITSLIALIVVVFFILRPLIKQLLARGGDQEVGPGKISSTTDDSRLEGVPVPLELDIPIGERIAEVEVLKKMADGDAQRFSELLRSWLK